MRDTTTKSYPTIAQGFGLIGLFTLLSMSQAPFYMLMSNVIDKELPPDLVVLYLRNNSDQDTRITITPLAQTQYPLNNQNPSLEFKDGSVSFCLSSAEVVRAPENV